METVIYLDTHVVAWLYAGESARLSQDETILSYYGKATSR